MGWFKSIASRSDDVMVDTQQSAVIMTTQQRSVNKSNSGSTSAFGTNLLRNNKRYSVSARIRHGPLSSTMLSSPSASSYMLLLLVTFAYIACTFADPLSQGKRRNEFFFKSVFTILMTVIIILVILAWHR